MKRSLAFLLFVWAFVQWQCTQAPPLRLLVFSKTAVFRHESIPAGQAMFFKMAQEHGFAVDTTEDASQFNTLNLKKYNAVVFLNTTGDVLNPQEEAEMQRYLAAGGGFIGIHAAADTEYDWPWYGKLVGAYFNGHPNNPNVRDGASEVVVNDHICTAHLPERWQRTDEWYNYKDINPDIRVLINLDESTYEGGTNGDQHPITWIHEYGGGKVFYTGMGHTDETYNEPDYIQMIWGAVQYVTGSGQLPDYSKPTVAPEENRFTKVVLTDHLDEPMELEYLPDGRLIWIERKGDIKAYNPADQKITTITHMTVHHELEDGLLGMALDPNYATNHWIYFYYSPVGKVVNRLSRFDFDGKSLDMASEKVILEVATQRDECCHSGGSVEFGNDGLLYFSAGDNTNPFASEGYNPSDERPGRSAWDAQRSAGNTNDLRGKIMRIHPEPDGSYTIPDGNLFPKDGSQGRPEIFVMGCRNPFRISIDKHTGYLYWGDVGPDASKDSLGRGPRGYDEVNQAREAGYFGWPYFIGNNYAYNRYDFATGKLGEPRDPEHPENNSPNNTGATVLPPAHPAYIWYPYANSPDFPLVGTGGRNAMAGPVFYQDDYPDNPARYPAYYDGKLFTYDWIRGWIMAVTMDSVGNFVGMERFLPGIKWNNMIDVVMSPQGDMFMLEYGTVWFHLNPDARLVHLTYTAGNRPPVPELEASKEIGAAPMVVNFSADQSNDHDGDPLTFTWTIGEESVKGNGATLTHNFAEPGIYEVKVTVADPAGNATSANKTIRVGNEPPTVAWKLDGNSTFFWDNEQLGYEVEVTDKEDGTLGSGVDPKHVIVTMDYVEDGADLNKSAIDHASQVMASSLLRGKELLTGSDCMTCHQIDIASIGPKYLDVAKKYHDAVDAVNYLSDKVINGGNGVWGETAMAAHPALKKEEAELMVQYILSLADEKPKATPMAASGTLPLTKQKPGLQNDRFILIASYTDKGGNQVGPLEARDVVILRRPMLPAASFDGFDKVQKFELKAGQAPGITQDMELVIGSHEGYVLYKDLDLTGIGSVTLIGSAPASYMKGGTVEIHADAVNGPLLGKAEIKTNEDMAQSAFQIPVALKENNGIHNLYLTFTSATGQDAVCTLTTLLFNRMESM
ncbi:MAG: ThuA domain-containing protein [Saprospiraceae bacterium]|nr:ThuA domain-containing protein [Saprospiraceae bacterium]